MSMSSKFLDYCKTHRLPPASKFTVYLGGGMAVKLYLKERGVKPLPVKVASTTDFDFTYSVNHPLSDEEVPEYARKMYFHMFRFLSGFINPTKLSIKSYARKSKIPASGKKTYHVVQFKKNGEDFVDCTLAYVPGFSKNQLNTDMSKRIGLPIKKLVYMKKDILTVLAGSFIYKFIKPRNPLTGNNPEKGRRNVARVSALHKLKVSSPKTVAVSEFLKAVRAKKRKEATRKARGIIEKIRLNTKR